MTHPVEDSATRPVYYKSRFIHLKLDQEKLKKIDETSALLEKEADPAAIEKSKKMLGQMESMLDAPHSIIPV